MNAITDPRVAPHSPADWPPVPGQFRIRLGGDGPFVSAEIRQAMGLWSALVDGQSCGLPHPDPAKAAGVDHVWEFGTRVSPGEFAELNGDLSRDTPIASDPPPIGHNRPPIDLAAALEPEALNAWITDQFRPHTERAGQIIATHRAFLLATPAGIATEAMDAKATELVRLTRMAAAGINLDRVKIKAPVLEAQRAIDGAAGAITAPLETAAKEAERRIAAFRVDRDQRIVAEAAAEARRAREAAELLLDQAATTGNPEIVERAAEAQAEQQHFEGIVSAPIGERTRVRGAAGSSNLKDCWSWTVEDLSKVPAHLLMLNEKAVAAQLKTTPKGVTPMIPGLHLVNTPKLALR